MQNTTPLFMSTLQPAATDFTSTSKKASQSKYEVDGIRCNATVRTPNHVLLVWQWLRQNHPHAIDIAIVSDHEPMATAQRRWFNHHGGFSGAWPLNDFFWELYAYAPAGARRDVFYCPGELNVADGISRSNRLCDKPTTKVANGIVLPSLDTFWHPYTTRPTRPQYHV